MHCSLQVEHSGVTVPPTQDNKPEARVAYTRLCKDKNCSVTRSPHLVIENLVVPLEEDRAKAISYTWGEFNRQQVFIGHSSDEQRRRINIELGEEWTALDVTNSLAELSSDGPIWLDQLCIVQNDEAIRDSLAKIPAIFRTFPVVVLMPDHPCKCLDELVQKYKTQDTEGSADPYSYDALILEDVQRYEKCLNFTPSSSWFRRLWTRQELMYSRSIRCVWASKKVPTCVLVETSDTVDSAHLPRYLALKRQSLLDKGFSAFDADMKLLVQQNMVAHYGRNEISLYWLGYAGHRTEQGFRFYDFLSGALLQSHSRTTTTMPNNPINWFTRDIFMIAHSFLGDLHVSTRKSTHLRDYVLAVWPDCPKYVMPKDFGNQELHCLMQDAWNQLHANHYRTIFTTAPQGLFGRTSHGSAVWLPSHYHRILQSVKAQSEISFLDVYGPIHPGLTYGNIIDSHKVPLVFSADPELPISATAKDYNAYIAELVNENGEDKARSIIIEQLRPMIRKWTRHSHLAVNNHLTAGVLDTMAVPPKCTRMPAVLPLVLMMKLFGKDNLAVTVDDHFEKFLEKDPWAVVDIGQVLYTMMAMALRLNEDVCRESGVRIMLSGGEPQTMRLGFYRGDIDLSSLGSKFEGRGGMKSVCMDRRASDGESLEGRLIYEAKPASPLIAHGELGGCRLYKVFGIWIPLQDTSKDKQEYNAEVWAPEKQPSPDASPTASTDAWLI